MARHKHADLMIQAAENWDGLEWRWQYQTDLSKHWTRWILLTEQTPCWEEDKNYELRPIRSPVYQKRVEVPRAETEAPKYRARYFSPCIDTQDLYIGAIWMNESWDKLRLKRGLVYLTAEDAAARGRAMVETEVEE